MDLGREHMCQRLQEEQPAGPGWRCDLGDEPALLWRCFLACEIRGVELTEVQYAFLESMTPSPQRVQYPESSYVAEFSGSQMGVLSVTQETFGDVWRHFWLLYWVESATWYAVSQECCQPMHRTAPTTQNHLAPNVPGAEAQKPCLQPSIRPAAIGRVLDPLPPPAS